MPSTDSQTPTREDFVRWGTAPEDRQCRYTFASGYHCHRWSVRGHQYCQEHGRWMECRVDGPIEVPLMEDPQAVELVASQTVRAVGWGHIPPANGRAILHGCRVVQTGFAQGLAEAKFRLKCHTLGLDANQFLPARNTGPEHRAGNPTESVILSGARSAQPKDLHSTADTPQIRVPHVSPVLEDVDALCQDTTSSRAVEPDKEIRVSAPEEIQSAGAPLKPSSGLSGIQTSAAADGDISPSPIAHSAIAVEATAFRPGNADEPGNNGASAPENSVSSEESTDALCQGTTSSRAVEPDQEIRALAPEGSSSHADETAQDAPFTKPNPAPYPHPLDDLPPAPRPKSVCEPCVEALRQGADESLVDCKHCPAHNSGNLRAPQLPDPRNTPEPAYDSRTAPSPETPPFRDLKNNWDRDLRRASNQRLRPNDHRPGQTYEEILASRARPYDDYLRALPTSPPPPIPGPDAH